MWGGGALIVPYIQRLGLFWGSKFAISIFLKISEKKFFGGMEFLVGILRGVTSKLGYLKGSFLKSAVLGSQLKTT